MKLLANENVPRVVVEALRTAGHDVSWIHREAPGATDADVLAAARRDECILLTFDKDFGEFAFRSGLPPSLGIILCRFRPVSPEWTGRHVVSALSSRTDWVGQFSVIEDDRIRMTPLPEPKDGN